MARPGAIALACLGVWLGASACTGAVEEPSQTRELELGPAVTRLAVAGPLEVIVTVTDADPPSATVAAPPDTLEDVEIAAEGDTLRVVFHGDVDAASPPRATVTLPVLERIAVGAASGVQVVGSGSDALGVGASGGSTITLTGLALRFLTLDLDGGSLVAAEGTAAALEANLSGASTATLDGLAATDAVLELRGASTATVAVSSSLEVTASGASSVRYATPPAQLSEYTSGGSTVGPMEG